jgi:hypothetical protein
MSYVPPHKRKPSNKITNNTNNTAAHGQTKGQMADYGKKKPLEYPCLLAKDFPSSAYTAKDLQDAFYAFGPLQSIKWTSNTSAILTFPTLALAQDALDQVHDFNLSPCAPPPQPYSPVLPTSTAAASSDSSVLGSASVSDVVKPVTSAAVAHRLVAQALGLPPSSKSKLSTTITSKSSNTPSERKKAKEEREEEERRRQLENDQFFND